MAQFTYNAMIHSRLRQRQRIIQECILKREQQKLEVIHLGLSDPFQTYYYPAQLEEPEEIEKLYGIVQSKIKETQNIKKLSQAESLLKHQLSVVQSKINAEKQEHSMLDYLISSLQDKITRHDITNSMHSFQKKQKKYFSTASTQTKQVQKKQKGVDCKRIIDTNSCSAQTKNAQLSSSSAYSLSIHNQKTVINKLPKYHEENQKKRRYLKMPRFLQNSNNQKIDNLYSQLQKQISYLEHIKPERNKKKYAEQKKKVGFMIELFWKNARQLENDQSSVSLPLIEI